MIVMTVYFVHEFKCRICVNLICLLKEHDDREKNKKRKLHVKKKAMSFYSRSSNVAITMKYIK
jgi:hypothetical protein